jgi:diguanylate cyclase (GGDEF)-like protein
MRTVIAAGFATMGLTAAVATFVPDSDSSDHAPLMGLAAGCALVVLVLGLLRRPSLLVLRAFLVLAVLLVDAGVAACRPVGAAPVFYLWPVLVAACFLSGRDVVALLAFVAVGFAAALALTPPDVRLITYVGTLLLLFMTAGVVMAVRARLRATIDGLERAAATDPLTGLLNRGAFTAALDREVARVQRSGRPLAVAIFDLDRFKAINDRFGHAEGDAALVRFAEILREECRAADVVARTGGEEFTVVLAEAGADAAAALAHRVRVRLERETARDRVPLTVSAGVAELPRPATSPEPMLLAADRALYAAKAAGRGRVGIAPAPGCCATGPGRARVEPAGAAVSTDAGDPPPSPSDPALARHRAG